MHQIDYITLIVYQVAVLIAGLAMARYGKSMKSYFAAGGQAPWWISGFSLYMAFFSAGTFVVWGSIAYLHGWVAITIQWCMCVAGFITAVFIAPRWRRSGALTAAEFIQRRLGTGLQQFYSYIVLIHGLFATGAVLYPVAKMVSVSTPFSLEACLLVIGGMVVLYTAVGGLWAVLITDTLQFVLLMAAVVAVVPLALTRIGGLGALVSGAPEGYFNLFGGEYTGGFAAAFILYSIFFLGGQWGFVQRYTSVPSEKDARKVGFLYAALYVISPIIWMLPPMVYRVINPGLNGTESEDAYILMSRAVLPIGFIGLMFSSMISATASGANTTLNVTAAVFTNDIYKNLINPNASEKSQMLVARLSTLFFGAVVIGIALLVPKMGGIVNLVLTTGAMAGGPVMAPPMVALFSRYIDARGAMLATVIGLVVNAFFMFVSPWLLGYSLSRAAEFAVGVGVASIVLIAYDLVMRVRGQKDPHFEVAFAPTDRMRMPTAEELADDRAQRVYSLRVLAVSLSFVGAGIMSLYFFVPGTGGLTVGMGLPILLSGIALGIMARRQAAAEVDASPESSEVLAA